MALFAPVALALALLALPIVLLYMLRLRRREQPISSTMLWRDLVRDRAANAPWQPLRRNLLLLLQLLALAALVLALARPALWRPGPGGGDVIVLLDASASMQAGDGARGARFDDASAAIGRLIDGLGGDDRMTLIRVGRSPVALAAATGDRGALRRALDAAAPESAAADWPAAFALAAGSTQGLGVPRIFIVSDGRLPDGLPALPGEVTFIPVGRSGDNLALTTTAARATPQGTQVLVTATNPGPSARSALLSLVVDGVLYDSRRLDVAPAQSVSQGWTVPSGASAVEARLEPRDGAADYLALDDRAWAVLQGSNTRRVLLIGEGNLFLERFFAVLPGYELVRAMADEAAATGNDEAFDLYVYDGVALPDGPLPGNVLVFDPQPTSGDDGLLAVSGVFSDTTAVRLADSPLLENVIWRDTTVAAAQQVDAPALEPLIEAKSGPLLLAGEVDGRRVAVFTFDLRDSDLPLQIAFPVIMANITAWLSPGRVITDENPQPGVAVTILPGARAATVVVTQPDGAVWEEGVQAGEPVRFLQTQQTGLYRVAFRDDSGATQPAGTFAVNFLDAAESRIQPADTLRLGQADIAPAADVAGLRPLWPWLLAGGLAVLSLEWWISYRRGLGRPLFKMR